MVDLLEYVIFVFLTRKQVTSDCGSSQGDVAMAAAVSGSFDGNGLLVAGGSCVQRRVRDGAKRRLRTTRFIERGRGQEFLLGKC